MRALNEFTPFSGFVTSPEPRAPNIPESAGHISGVAQGYHLHPVLNQSVDIIGVLRQWSPPVLVDALEAVITPDHNVATELARVRESFWVTITDLVGTCS